MKMELTAPALERLIGGDTEIELTLRRQIAQNFFNLNIKCDFDDKVKEELLKLQGKAIDRAVEEQFGIKDITQSAYWPTLSHTLKSLIQTEVDKRIQEAVDNALKKVIEYQNRYWGKEINTAVEKALNAEIEKKVQEGIQTRLNKALFGE